MNTILMNFQNSKRSDPNRLFLNFADKLDWRKRIIILFYQIVYYTWKNIKKSDKKNQFKISATT